MTKDILTATGSEDILLSAEAMFTNLTDNLKSSGAAAVYDDTEWRIGIPLTSLILPHLCACPSPGPGFPVPYIMIFSFYSLG